MTTTKRKVYISEYSPSVSIERDYNRSLNYIPTKNATDVFNSITNDYKSGTRSFSLVGAYGTGKSAFLLGLQKTLSGKEKYFTVGTNMFSGKRKFEFINLSGQYESLIENFAVAFELDKRKEYSASDVIKAIALHAKRLNKQEAVCVIIIDEFGKYLEYAAKHNPEKELYFIQLLAELVNNDDTEFLFITTLHQDFNGYSRSLAKSQQNEWDKVKGRLKEIPFNEPVEQLLFLGAERISQIQLATPKDNFSSLYKAIAKAKIFPLSDYNTPEFAQKLLPFDILSASVMTLALQKYGQNERSLFAFIESQDPLGIRGFKVSSVPFYNLECVYDYLVFNFYSYLNTTRNPDKQHWFAMRTAIERCEGLLENKSVDAIKIIKTIGLLNLFGATSGKLNSEFLEQYGKFALGIANPKTVIQLLLRHKIIRFVNFNQKFVLFEGTDIDIEWVINEAGNLVERVSDVVHHLHKYFDASLIPAKAAFYQKGTPRFFQFLLSDKIELDKTPEGEIDGYINLIFSDTIKENELKVKTASCHEAVLFGLFKNTTQISNEIFNIEKLTKAIDMHRDDSVAVRVMDGIKQQHVKLLNHYVSGSIYSRNNNTIWYFHGRRINNIRDRKTFNQNLSIICEQVYSDTPIYKNEMLNKSNYHSVIARARRDLMSRLVSNSHLENIGYEASEFPPDKTIYLSLIHATGIHKKNGDTYILKQPGNSLKPIWNESMKFLESTKFGKRNINELIGSLSKRPFKIKQGLIDFWLPIFLLIKKDDFALFYDEAFVPNITDDTLDLIVRSPHKYEVKAFQVEGVRLDLFNRYRKLIEKEKSEAPQLNTFIDTIKPFISFYKGLTSYAQNTCSISNNSQRLREAIVTSKDPETTFFEKFPEAMGYTILKLRKSEVEMQHYVTQIQDSIRELRTVYFDLLDRFEKLITHETLGKKASFEIYKEALQERVSSVKEHLLNQSQKKFYKQILSPMEDRNAWLNAIAHACVDKRLDSFNDNDEKVLHEKFVHYLHQLDNLCELSKTNIDYDNEDVVKLEITSFVENIKERIIRMPKAKTQEAAKLALALQGGLSKDRQLNIVTLVKLLQEQLNND